MIIILYRLFGYNFFAKAKENKGTCSENLDDCGFSSTPEYVFCVPKN